ncbi:hypothetical protein [Streptomyces daliensis]|uniref:Uncharacterized protein n=1 Tax=Streptomyces daliensis TaxID=299421 RepID=A0A8T4J1B0_9ACTN|nr:hypothetical protein [Streptomyces daliensis]
MDALPGRGLITAGESTARASPTGAGDYEWLPSSKPTTRPMLPAIAMISSGPAHAATRSSTGVTNPGAWSAFINDVEAGHEEP